MEDVRNDVMTLLMNDSGAIISPIMMIEEEEEVTQEQFNKMMDTWIAE
jgi:ribonuclease PH